MAYQTKVHPEKEAIVKAMEEKLASKGVVLLSFNQLDVKNATILRRKFREHGVEYKVIKNTLTRIAADNKGFGDLDQYLAGPNGLACSADDPVAPAKALKEFLKETESKAITIKCGVLDGKVIGPDQVQALADLPDRDQLLSMLAQALQGPITGLARALNGNITKLALALEAVRKQKESA
jgi:large subunit ribosomal protein L10